MSGSFLLARRYSGFHRGRTAILVSAIILIIYLPLVTHWAIRRFQQQAISRARATPLVIGAKGSRFGLVIHALHFRGDPPEPITMGEIDRIAESRLAVTIPIFARFRARGHVIVGTTPDYYAYRGLAVARGNSLARLGDCVLGATAAKELDLQPGDKLLSEPENPFDLSGPSPLNMRVVGILQRTGTADDDVIFADLKTTWIIQGIGHGHEGISRGDSDHQHKASRANLAQYVEVTDDNLHTFHFHGTPEAFPLTAIIARPDSEKSEALLMGRYLAPDETTQALKPVEVVAELLEIILHIRTLLDLGMSLLAVVMLLLVSLVLLLSLRLRQREMNTMFRIGCSRTLIFQIQAVELGMVVLVGLLLAVALAWGTVTLWNPIVDWWLS